MKFLSFYITPGTLLIGAGAVLLAPMALSVVAGILRSATKLGIKTVFLSYETGKKNRFRGDGCRLRNYIGGQIGNVRGAEKTT
jgi:hypothetical protein